MRIWTELTLWIKILGFNTNISSVWGVLLILGMSRYLLVWSRSGTKQDEELEAVEEEEEEEEEEEAYP